jgi:ribosomal protein S17E
MKYYTHPYLLANYPKMVEFRRAIKLNVFTRKDLYSVDRMGIIGNDPDIIVIQPLLNYDSSHKYDFDTLIESRAKELIELSNTRNVPIYLMWSGGIDSTSVYCAIKKYLTDNKKLVILCNKNSIKEYPELYNEMISEHDVIDLGIVEFALTINKLANIDSIFVTGELGDQLFMSRPPRKKSSLTSIDWINDPWEAVLDPNASQYHNVVDEYVKNFPIPIITARDFGRSVKFNLEYQRVQLRLSLYYKNLLLNKNLFHFYDTEDFNYYSLSLSLDELGIDYRTHTIKLPLKQLILDYTGDQHYYENKPKVKRIMALNPTQITNTIDENWNKSLINLSYTSNSNNEYIVDQPATYQGESKSQELDFNTGIVDWKFYHFDKNKCMDCVTEEIINQKNYIVVCGFAENKPKTLDNFFIITGTFSEYNIKSDNISILILNQIVSLKTIKLIGNHFQEEYDQVIKKEFEQRISIIDCDEYELIDPKNYSFTN